MHVRSAVGSVQHGCGGVTLDIIYHYITYGLYDCFVVIFHIIVTSLRLLFRRHAAGSEPSCPPACRSMPTRCRRRSSTTRTRRRAPSPRRPTTVRIATAAAPACSRTGYQVRVFSSCHELQTCSGRLHAAGLPGVCCHVVIICRLAVDDCDEGDCRSEDA